MDKQLPGSDASSPGGSVSSYAHPNAMGNYFFLSHRKKFMFMCISKNACTTLKYTLYEAEFGAAYQEDDTCPIHWYWGFEPRKDTLVDRRDTESLGRHSGYRRFAVYRDPVERFMSMYHNKVLSPPRPHYFFETFGLQGMALDPFLDAVEEILGIANPLHIDEHIRPQSRYYLPEDIDHIVPIDRLDGFLMNQFGIRSQPRANRTDTLVVQPNREQRARICHLYHEDYELQKHIK